MFDINYLAVAVATMAAFLAGGVWSRIVFGDTMMKLQDANWTPSANPASPPVWKLLIEVARCLGTALVLAYLIANLAITGWVAAIVLGLLLWAGFPLVLLVGPVVWQGASWKLAAINAGDWLVKLLIIAIIISVWN